MKRILALLMAITLLFSLCACKKDGEVLSNNESDIKDSADFVKPENYAAIIGLKINPEFELYIDDDEKLLALNAVNDDAKAIKDGVDLSESDIGSVVSAIVKKANESGYVKTGGYMTLKVVNVLDSSRINAAATLKKASDSAKKTVSDLNIDFDVRTDEEEQKDTTSDTSSENDTSSKQETSSKNDTSSKQETSSKDENNNKTENSSKEETGANKPEEPTIVNPKTHLKKGEEYVSKNVWREDDIYLAAGGISVDDEEIVILLTVNFAPEGHDPNMPTDRTPLVYGGKKYYRYGAGQTPCYYE